MSEESSAQDRTEEPTSRRLSQAKEKGQVPRSRELDTVVLLLVAGATMVFLGAGMVQGLMDVLHMNMVLDREMMFDTSAMTTMLKASVYMVLKILGPFLAIMVIASIAAPMMMGGRTFSTEPLKFNLTKLDPVKGLKKIFAWKGLMELGKALVKFLLVGSVGVYLLYHYLPDFLLLSEFTAKQGIARLGEQLLWIFIILSSVLVLIAAVDVPFQKWDHRKQLRMTRQEVREEVKDTEGSPEVKNKIRTKQFEAIARRMMEAVPKADVVVTNPTHYAVALKYDQMKMSAPIVVATGVDEIAGHIRRIAVANDVPILEAPALARALYHSTELDHPIPEGLYLAVAQVLAYIYQLHRYEEDGGLRPEPANEYPIPDELRRDK